MSTGIPKVCLLLLLPHCWSKETERGLGSGKVIVASWKPDQNTDFTEMYLFPHMSGGRGSRSKVLAGLAFSEDISRAIFLAVRSCPVAASLSQWSFHTCL